MSWKAYYQYLNVKGVDTSANEVVLKTILKYPQEAYSAAFNYIKDNNLI